MKLDIIDAQAHIFLTIGEQEALAAMNALGIQGVMIDEVWSIVGEEIAPFVRLANGTRRPVSPRAEAASLKHPERFSYIQRIERTDPQLADLLSVYAGSSGCRSVRIDLRLPEERQAFMNGGYDQLISLVQRHDMPLSLLGRDTGATVAGTIARFPDLRFILDHCGSPRTPEQWEEVLPLAKFKNVWMKWSGPGKAFGGAYPFSEALKQFSRAIDTFGVERLMWATDFTQNETGDSWADLLNYIRESTLLGGADKERFFAGTAREVFKWPAPPKK